MGRAKTVREATWVVDSGRPKEPCVRCGVQRAPCEWAILGERTCRRTHHPSRQQMRSSASGAVVALSPAGDECIHCSKGWRGWQMQFNRLCVVAMRPFVKLLWPLVVLHTFQIINAGQKCHKNLNMYDRSKATFPVYCHPKCLSSQHSTYTFRSWKSFLSGYWHRTVHPSGSISGERMDKISWVIPLADNRKNVQPLKLSHGSIITDQDG